MKPHVITINNNNITFNNKSLSNHDFWDQQVFSDIQFVIIKGKLIYFPLKPGKKLFLEEKMFLFALKF